MRKTYPKYKASSLPWPASLPDHWGLARISSAFVDRREIVSDKDFAPLSVTKNGILPQLDTAAKTDNGDNRKKVVKGDFVINSRSDRKGSAGVSPFEGSVSVISTVLKPQAGKTNSAFVGYLLTNYYFQEEFYRYGKGIVDDLWSTKFNDMKVMQIPFPSLPEQTQIAKFLDHKCTLIDTAIQKKTRLIELLKEQKQAIINRAVTRGLNPDAPMKNSGIEWLGEIPAHWEVKKLKYVSKVLRGKFTHRPRNDDRLYGGIYPFIQTGSITSTEKYIEEYSQTLNEWGYSVSKEFPKETVVMSIAANIADVAILNFNACFPDSIVGFVPTQQINLEYLFFQLRTMRSHFFRIATINTQLNLNIERVASVFLAVPTIVEQIEILKHIDSESKIIDTAISRIEREIELIKEYKTALIAEAVTGKIDVRDWKPKSKTTN